MPENAGWIEHECHPQAPGLLRGGLWRLNPKLAGQIQARDVLPPCIQVVDHELQHGVLGPLLLEVALQNEPTRAGIEDSHLGIEDFLKSKRFVKALGQVEVPAREECADSLSAFWNLVHNSRLLIRTTNCAEAGQA